jgi:gentisate 1,2-dioxygenase
MTAPSRTPSAEQMNARKAFYDQIGKQHLAPLWERVSGLVTKSPQPAAVPVHWKYSLVRGHLLHAGSLLSAEEAERRVLIFENPGLPGQSRITGSLFSGLQLLMPGEKAHAHRHTASALRVFLEGSSAYTAVDGERTKMSRGDFVITPCWTWHDHGNDGPDPVIWLDGLDVPIVNLFDTSFAEGNETSQIPMARPEHDSEARYAGALLPDGLRSDSLSSPLLNYRYTRARDSLAQMQRNGPTMSAALQLVTTGFRTAPYRSTDSTVFVVIEGTGHSQVGDSSFDWAENDVFVAPSWALQQHRAGSEAILFSFSDRAAQEKLGIWRERRDPSAS